MKEELPLHLRMLLGLGCVLAPQRYRDEWRREWTAELWFAIRSDRGGIALTVRTLACVVDAIWLWRRMMTMNGWTRDLRTTLRSYLRRPTMAGVMVLSLGVGLGATATIFSVVDSVLLEDLPLPEPDRLVRFSLSSERQGITDWPFSHAQYRELSRRMRSAEISVVSGASFNLVTEDEPLRMDAVRVSDTYFSVSGVHPVVGRAFSRQEEAAGRRVALVSHAFWQQHLGGTRAAMGRSLNLAGEPHEVIGVMPPETRLAQQLLTASGDGPESVDIYVPIQDFASRQGDLVSTMWMIGRLTAGSSIDDARREAVPTLIRFLEERGRTGWEAHVTTLHEHLVAPVRAPLLVMLSAATILLVMVCANLCALILINCVDRSGEWAARRALGADRFRIARHLLMESVVLSTFAGGVALLFAFMSMGRLKQQALGSLPRAHELSLDAGTLGLVITVTTALAVLLALVSALATYRSSPAEALTTSRQTLSTGGRRALRSLVVVEVGLAVVLLVGSGVLLRSFGNLMAQRPGYELEGVVRAMTQLDAGRYSSDEEIAQFTRALTEGLEAVPEIEELGVAALPGVIQKGPRKTFQRGGLAGDEHQFAALENAITPGYFGVLGIDVVEGRGFTDADDAGSPPVTIITQQLADQLWPGESAVGKRILSGSWRRFNTTGRETTPVLREVVGVVHDLTGVGLEPGDPARVMYWPMDQAPWLNQAVLLRTRAGAELQEATLRAHLQAIAPEQPFYGIEPAAVDFRDAVERERISTLLISGFAAAALLLSILGIYGVVAYSVALRRREIGIRMAIGADVGKVSALFFRDGLIPVVVGLTAGLLVALLSVRLLEGMLYGVSPVDPITFGAAGMLLGASALLSTYLPARRTAGVDPVEALRLE